MPEWRVSEQLPPTLGMFDLVIVDEASQSDITALPAILRGKKLLIVGDDKQVSPSTVGIEERRALIDRGYRIRVQVKVGAYRIDLVVEGAGDKRLAVECDGDRYHTIDKWADDMNRQKMLERMGWDLLARLGLALACGQGGLHHRPAKHIAETWN